MYENVFPIENKEFSNVMLVFQVFVTGAYNFLPRHMRRHGWRHRHMRRHCATQVLRLRGLRIHLQLQLGHHLWSMEFPGSLNIMQLAIYINI